MELQTLNATTRLECGKGAASRTRGEELVPTVLYGGGQDSVALAVNKKEFVKVLHGRGGEHALLQLTVVDKPELSSPAMIKEVQHHKLKGHVLHADFQRIRLDQRITTLVSIVLKGQPLGVVDGGVLDQQLRDLEIMCLPNAIPDSIQVDVSALDLGSNLHVSDLVVPEGIDVMSDAELTVATVLIPRGLRDEAAAAQETAAAAPAAKAEKSE